MLRPGGPIMAIQGDNWRFYGDAGQALAYWSGRDLNGVAHPVAVEETFHILPDYHVWSDFVCIWKRTDEKVTSILVSHDVRYKEGPLKRALHTAGCSTKAVFQ